MTNNLRIAKIFSQIAEILEVQGENPFRIRAYRRAAQTIEALSEDISDISAKGELTGITGIGTDLAGKIREFIETGRISFFEDLKKKVSPAFLKLIDIPGVGPKTAKLLVDELKIKDIDDLEAKAKAHRLSKLPGIRRKTEENIIRGIQIIKRGRERVSLGIALPMAEEIVGALKKAAGISRMEVCGSLRRRKETIRDIDVLVTAARPSEVMDVFVGLSFIKQVIAHGPTKSSAITKEGVQVDVRAVEPESFGAALLYFTGSKEHNIRLREAAVKKGLKINEYGIFSVKSNKRLGGSTEEQIYRMLGLKFIPPELREDRGEIKAAFEDKLPHLVELADIKGDFHVHTKASDGSGSIQDLVKMAAGRGYEYMAVTDHSQSLRVAGGLKERQLLTQVKNIRAINKGLKGFRVLAGTEVDILDDGSIDFRDEVLSKLDIVVAAIHSGFRQSKDKLTKRIIRAMQNRYVSVIAHPTGRLMGSRDAYAVDIDEIFRAARDTNTALEINAFPSRLDLDDTSVKKAAQMGIMLAIGTDTHHADQLDNMKYGLSVARRGWLEKKNILNSFSADEVLKRIRKKRRVIL
jgi:DNA polymerase (family 10)